MEGNKRYYPDLARLLPDGNLRVPISSTFGRERCTGYETIDPTHPKFAEWMQIVKDRGPLDEAVKARRRKDKEQRRARLRAARPESSSDHPPSKG